MIAQNRALLFSLNTDSRAPRPLRLLSMGMAILSAGALLVAGCGSQNVVPAIQPPVQVPSATATPRAIIYGGFLNLLPRYDVTPALQMFLYGPNDYGKTALRNPQGMALMNQLLLVCDQGLPDVVAINLDTGRSLPFVHPDDRPRCPVAVAVDGNRAYVADTTQRCVLVYNSGGRLCEELAPSPEPNRQFRPASLLVREGILYAGNIAQRRVDRFDLATRQWLEPITAPAGTRPLVAPAGLDMLSDGTLLIVDAVQGQVLRRKADGEWLAPIGRPGRRTGEFVRPKQVAHTPSGMILVVDSGRQSVLVFDAQGRHLMELVAGDSPWRGFTLPVGVVSLPAERVGSVTARLGTLPPAEEYILVSDELGAPSLTLIGLVPARPPEAANAR